METMEVKVKTKETKEVQQHLLLLVDKEAQELLLLPQWVVWEEECHKWVEWA